MDQLIATIEKNADEEIRVSLREYKGHPFIDVRVYWKPPEGEPGPTKKGVTLNPELFPELMAAALQRRDLRMWAAKHDIVTARGQGQTQ